MAASVQVLSKKDGPTADLLDEKRTATDATLSSSSEPTTRTYNGVASVTEEVMTTENSNHMSPARSNVRTSATAENTSPPSDTPLVDGSTKPTGDSDEVTKNVIPDDNVIDSALLSALSDQRERFALLRLEQTLVDFMKDSSRPCMQVGGPGNSIVSRTASCENLGASSAAAPTTPTRGKQTSFQRLCLHRLADRFNIVREVVENSNYGCGPGLIRLVKVKNSRIPKKLLIDLDDSDYAQLARLDNATETNNNGTSLSADVHGLTHSLSSSALTDRVSASLAPKTPPKKMVIMKRGSSSFGSTGSLKGKDGNNSGGSNKSKIKGKNLTDKEKAYAEARARIFNESASSLQEGDEQGSPEQQQQANNSITTPSASALSSAVTSPSTTPPPPQPQPTASTTSSPPLSETAAAAPEICTLEEQQEQSPVIQQDASGNVKLNRPAAATSGGVSKVTWRNRRQEENDPDFQRLRVVAAHHHGVVPYHGMHSSDAMTGAAATYGGGAAAPPTMAYHVPATAAATQVSYHAQPPQHYYVQQQQQQQAAPQAQPYYGQAPGTTAFYHSSQMQQQSAGMPAGTNRNPQGRGGGGRGYGSQQWSYNNTGRGEGSKRQGAGANVNSMDDFPALG